MTRGLLRSCLCCLCCLGIPLAGADTVVMRTGGTLEGVVTFGAIFRMINKLRGPDMPRIHAHLLRHSIAVHLVRKGADIHHVQAFLGHGNLNTTKIYLRMVPGQLAQSYEQYMPDIAVDA